MECEMNDSDEELEALRLAALATLKSRPANKQKNESLETSPRNTASPVIPSTLSSVLCTRKKPGPPTKYSWRNSTPQSHRGRGRGGFPPKINQRSNLIVITPVSTDDKDASENTSKPQLSLPQHRWCQAVNENSSSPKTFSRKGPTRFNRHESGSESSDSDYDDVSDQDSYSNETILQDENSMNFTQLTPEESVENESELMTERNPDHRLSFQNTNLENVQPAEHILKSTYSLGGIDGKIMSSSTLNDSFNRDLTNYSSYQEHNPNPGTCYQSQIVSSVPVNGGLRIDQNYDSSRRRLSDATPDDYLGGSIKSCSVDPNLSQNDLRIELKKRMLKLRSETADLAKSEIQSVDKHVCNERRISDDFRRGYSRDSSRNHNRSRSDITDDSHVRNRSRSLSCDRNRLRSPSPRNLDHAGSHGRDRDHKRNSKRDYSPGSRHNRRLSRSSDRNGKSSWSRSPVKNQRETSVSPSRDNKRNYSCSPERSKRNNNRSPEGSKHDNSRSPERSKRNSRSPERSKRNSHSPERSKLNSRSPKRNDRRSPEQSVKHSYSHSPDRIIKHDNGRSPERINKHDSSRSPERSNKRHYSRSPVRSTKHNHSPDKRKKQDYNRSPNRNHKRISSPSSKKDKSSHSPYKSRKRSLTQSPDRTSKHDIATSKSRKRSRTRSPVRTSKRNSSLSPDKSHRKSPLQNLEWKHKLNISPHESQKHNSSKSPEKKPSLSKRDRSRTPVQSHRHDSSESPERNRGRNRKKDSRHRWSHSSRSSSTLSSSSGSSSHSRSPRFRSLSSVIKPVQSSVSIVSSVILKDKRQPSPDSDISSDLKKRKDLDEKPKALSSLVKSSIVVGDNRNNAPDGGKRLPVHMRLGTLPRNKLIRMTKDVEAAFVNTSSDDNEETGTEGKKQNFRVVAEMSASKSDVLKRRVEKSPLKNSESKSRRKKTYR